MFSSEHKLRHLPFFEEISRHEEHEPAWKAATAGLVVLRFVDAWIEDGAHVVQEDEWALRSVRATIDEVEARSNLGGILRGIVDLMAESTVDVRLLAPRLMAYGQLLEYESQWAMAGDVYATIIAHTHPSDEADIATRAHSRRGFCLRHVGDVDASVAAYHSAEHIAEAAGDMEGVLRARVGEASTALMFGNLPRAESILDDTIGCAAQHNLSDVHSIALHERAVVAGERGDYELSIRLAYEALELTQSSRARDRILGDIAVSFHRLGVRSAARDAWLILATTAQEQYQRWQSSLNLMEISAEEGDEIMFEYYRRAVDEMRLPPKLAANYWLQGGIGLEHLGRFSEARSYLERALLVAEEFDLHQIAFQVESTLEALGTRTRQAPSREIAAFAPEVQRVAYQITTERERLSV